MFKNYKTDDQKFSYCLGLDVASRIVSLPIKLDVEAFLEAAKTILEKGKPDVSQEEYEDTMGKLYQKLEEEKQKSVENSSATKAQGDAFRAENAKNPAVTVTESGLQIEILTEGKGKRPKATDTVKVHYEGTLINGKVFDSSYKRNEPIDFPLNQVIKGWTEGLQHAKVGGKLKLVIPPELAYGKRGAGADIPPDSTLIFVVELLDIL